ncbi:MAG: hypothetical protein RIC80_15815 [Cyclobacteriaceae bacterium]
MNMIKPIAIFSFLLLFLSCNPTEKRVIDKEIMASLGSKHREGFKEWTRGFEKLADQDSSNVVAQVGIAEGNVILYIFGFMPREETLPQARVAFSKAWELDSMNSEVLRIKGMLAFLDWDWETSGAALTKSIAADSSNLQARHWYALWLTAMDRFDEAMAQSDIIMSMDTDDNHLVGRASFLYFQYRFEEMIPLMEKAIAADPNMPWAYDWLGMAYNGLGQHEKAIETYFKAFELSDGTVEVGGGLGHALGDAGEMALAKEMADYYIEASKSAYLPPVQRAFVHIGMDDFEKALELLEQAHSEKSWFLAFIQVEHWYDPLRDDSRFTAIMERMNYPG